MSSRMNTPTTGHAKPIIISLIGLAMVFGLLYAWRVARNGDGTPHAQPPALVSTFRVQARSVADELQAVGSLQAVHEVLLAPEVSGRVTAIHFTAGQVVKEGATLVQLYDAPERADRVSAMARADFAQSQLKRSQELARTGNASREVLERRQADAAQAVAAVQQLDARIQ